MRLNEIKLGESAKIAVIHSQELELTLMKLGLVRGDRVRLTNLAPFRGPLALQCNGSKVALRWHDAAMIEVEPADG